MVTLTKNEGPKVSVAAAISEIQDYMVEIVKELNETRARLTQVESILTTITSRPDFKNWFESSGP